MNERKPREIACVILMRAEERTVFLDTLLAEALPGMTRPDKGLCQELVYGVTRWRGLLDHVIRRRTEGRAQKPLVQQLLRLGLYQLLWLDRVPDHAVVYETVELARQRGFGPQSGFVNAFLRGCARDRVELKAELQALREGDPAVGWSHPRWLVNRWIRRWGKETTGRLLAWDNQPAETYARINTLKADAGKLVERWRLEEKVDYDFFRADWLEENQVFRLREPSVLTQLGSFREGWFYVQDPSTLLAVRLLDPQSGDRILDCCAAPGGKATAMAERVGNQGLVVGRDIAPPRLALLRENCLRLGVTCVEPELASRDDRPPGESGLRFDRILVDAPCSNTGVLRRRVEARWRLLPENLDELAALQGSLLDRAVTELQRQGVLVYSTCSLEPEENRGVVDGFLERHPAFRLEVDRTLTPFDDGTDGAYVAVLRRG